MREAFKIISSAIYHGPSRDFQLSDQLIIKSIIKYLDDSDFARWVKASFNKKNVFTLDIYHGGVDEPYSFNQIPSSYFDFFESWNLLYQKTDYFFQSETINWYVKRVVYRPDIKKFREILERRKIDEQIDVLRNNSEFKKKVLLVLHPDKGGENDDFIFAHNLQEKINGELDLGQLINDHLPAVQRAIYKANLWFKVLDSSTDLLRAIHKPTLENIDKAEVSCLYLFAAYQGIHWHVMLSNGKELTMQVYQGEYMEALKTSVVVGGYAILQMTTSYLSLPVVVAYESLTLGYAAYRAVTNAYEFYVEYYEQENVPEFDMS